MQLSHNKRPFASIFPVVFQSTINWIYLCSFKFLGKKKINEVHKCVGYTGGGGESRSNTVDNLKKEWGILADICS